MESEAYFTKIYAELHYETYLYFRTGICARKLSVGKYNDAVQ